MASKFRSGPSDPNDDGVVYPFGDIVRAASGDAARNIGPNIIFGAVPNSSPMSLPTFKSRRWRRDESEDWTIADFLTFIASDDGFISDYDPAFDIRKSSLDAFPILQDQSNAFSVGSELNVMCYWMTGAVAPWGVCSSGNPKQIFCEAQVCFVRLVCSLFDFESAAKQPP